MPKRPSSYADRVEAFCPTGTRDQLLAIAYHMGARGELSTPVRNFVVRGIRDYIERLDGRDKRDFEEILKNVRIQTTMKSDLKQKTPVV